MCKIGLAVHRRFIHLVYIYSASTEKFYENIPFDLAIVFSSKRKYQRNIKKGLRGRMITTAFFTVAKT